MSNSTSIGFNKKRFNTNTIYLETGFKAEGILNSEKNETAPTTTNYKKGESTINLVLGVGKGRIENVTDMQMALNILNDLKKNSSLSKNITEEDAIALARTITMVNNRRILDFRRKRIFELSQIDSFLQKSGLIGTANINYFTSLSDNWNYAFNYLRNNGTEKFIRLVPMVTIDERKNSTSTTIPQAKTENTNRLMSGAAEVQVGINKYIAKNLKKQVNYGASISTAFNTTAYKIKQNNVVVIDTNSNYWQSSLSSFITMGYYPNTRSVIEFTVNDRIFWQHNLNGFDHALFGNLDVNYFISYNTRITANLFLGMANHLYGSNRSDTNFSTSLSFGITHFIR